MDWWKQGGVAAATGSEVENQHEVTKTFRIPESLGRRLKVHAAQKEKKILVDLITGCLVEKGA